MVALSYQVWVSIISIAASVLGGLAGGYLGVRIAIARLEERSLAQDASIRHLMDRIERLENWQFGNKLAGHG